jgi:hypothetical protein
VANQGDEGWQRWPQSRVEGGLVTRVAEVPCVRGDGGRHPTSRVVEPVSRTVEPAVPRSVEHGGTHLEMVVATGRQR